MPDFEEPPKMRRKFSLNIFSTVKVRLVIGKGDKKVEVYVPKERLCEESEYLIDACCWKKCALEKDRIIDLDHLEPKLFSLFLAWVFVGSVENSEDYLAIEGKDLKDRREAARKRHTQMIECYLLGQRLLAHDFKNAVMDLIVKSYESCFKTFSIIPARSSDVCRIYANTETDSPLRRTLVDMVYAKSSKSFHEVILSEADHDPSMLYEAYMSEVIMAGRPSLWDQAYNVEGAKACYEKNPCSYHEHPDMPYGYSCT